MVSHGVFPVATARGEPAYKTFKEILIVLLGSIVVKKWVFLYIYFAIPYKAFFCLCLTMMLSWCCVTKNVRMSLLFLLFVGAVPLF